MSRSAPFMSDVFPGVSARRSGRPSRSTRAWIFVVLPPRETPMAWARAPLMDGPPLTRTAAIGSGSRRRKERSHADCDSRYRSWQEQLQRRRLDDAGGVVVRRRMRRETVIAFAGKLPSCVVAMEACCGAHHMGRVLAAQGHAVRLMSPEYVRPYVKAQKN